MINWLMGFLAKSNICSHDWEITFADRRTLVPTERRCKKCGAKQVAHTTWIDKCQK